MLFHEIREFLAESAERPQIVAVVGPTASGKTAVAVKIAQEFSGEIINADSRQLYRHLEIGTAKTTAEEQQGVPHHLFSILEPDEDGNVAIWRPLAEKTIAEIRARGNLPIICGGTALFLNALTKNFQIPALPPQPEFRKKLENESAQSLWKRLQKIDPAAAEKIHPHNLRLVVRALEIHEFSGRKKSEMATAETEIYDTFFVGLTMEREILYTKIDQRVETMRENGFLKEVQSLLGRGFTENAPALQSHGYPEAIRFLRGEMRPEELWAKMKQNTRHYAKRQLTWWRRDPRVHWFHPGSLEAIDINSSKF